VDTRSFDGATADGATVRRPTADGRRSTVDGRRSTVDGRSFDGATADGATAAWRDGRRRDPTRA
jgi:hypothetical protein